MYKTIQREGFEPAFITKKKGTKLYHGTPNQAFSHENNTHKIPIGRKTWFTAEDDYTGRELDSLNFNLAAAFFKENELPFKTMYRYHFTLENDIKLWDFEREKNANKQESEMIKRDVKGYRVRKDAVKNLPEVILFNPKGMISAASAQVWKVGPWMQSQDKSVSYRILEGEPNLVLFGSSFEWCSCSEENTDGSDEISTAPMTDTPVIESPKNSEPPVSELKQDGATEIERNEWGLLAPLDFYYLNGNKVSKTG